MLTKWLFALGLSAPLALTSAMMYGRVASQHTAQGAALDVAVPNEWVPFSALLERVDKKGRRWVGRFYQASDGSKRTETGFTWERMERIGINNISAGIHYRWHPEKGWTAQPMQLPPGGWKPLLPTPEYLQSTSRGAPIEGLEILVKDRADITEFIAPQLNMFTIWLHEKQCSSPANDCGKRFSQIIIGEQPPELFEPDPGAPIVQLDTPGGVVRHVPR